MSESFEAVIEDLIIEPDQVQPVLGMNHLFLFFIFKCILLNQLSCS